MLLFNKFQRIKHQMVIAMLVPLILTVAFVSTISVRTTYAQNSTSAFGEVTSVFVNGKNNPLKYSITTGKLLGVVEDKDKATLIPVISAISDKGTLNIEIPRNILDAKGQSNADAKFVVHVDGKDATFRETSNNPTARTLSIDFNKDARLIEIIGTQATQSQ